MALVILVTHMQHPTAKAAGHIIAFVQAPSGGRNTYSLIHGNKALSKAARFEHDDQAVAAMDSIPDSPYRLDYEVLCEHEAKQRMATAPPNP